MSYPPAPWHLQGFSLQTLHLLDIDRVRAFIPAKLKIVPILPGKTLGGVYAAAYGAGSTLQYSELIVVSALIFEAGRIGSWISHIYVDHPESVAGGREIWGLPKQIAQFNWKQGESPAVQVSQDGELLCTISHKWQLPGWQQFLSVPAFGLRHSKLLAFTGQGNLQLHLAGIDLSVSSDSPFAELKLGQPWLAAYAASLDLTVAVPSVIQSY